MSSFAERLRMLRKREKLSQSALAEVLKISKSSINMYERGDREPGFETMEALADFFNVDMDYLLGRSNDEHSELTRTIQKLEAEIAAEKEKTALQEKQINAITQSLPSAEQEEYAPIREYLKIIDLMTGVFSSLSTVFGSPVEKEKLSNPQSAQEFVNAFTNKIDSAAATMSPDDFNALKASIFKLLEESLPVLSECSDLYEKATARAIDDGFFPKETPTHFPSDEFVKDLVDRNRTDSKD